MALLAAMARANKYTEHKMKSHHYSIALLLGCAPGLAGWTTEASAKPVLTRPIIVIGSRPLGVEDFIFPMSCKPGSICATVSPASAPTIALPALPPKVKIAP